MSPSTSRAESQARTRAALLRAGRRLFATRGFHATTIEEISAKAGFTRGAFYANFDDKGDLLLAIAEHDRERSFGRLGDELETLPDEEILGRFAEWMTSTLIADPLRRAYAEFAVAAERHSAHRRRLADNVRAIRTVAAEMIERYCRRHDVTLTVDYPTFAAMVTATVGGFAEQMRVDRDVTTDTVGLALVALWNGVQADASATGPR